MVNCRRFNHKGLARGAKEGIWILYAFFFTFRVWSYLSMTGGGWVGTQGFLDPVTGIAAVFGVQVIPRPIFDLESYGIWDQLEKLTYAGLGNQNHSSL